MSKGIIVLSAGGTGGHLFPAQALAHELIGRGWTIHLVTDERAHRYTGQFPAKEVHAIPSATVTSKNPLALLKTGWTLFRGVRASRRLYDQLKPNAVVGFGGYPTLPPLFAATRAGIPTLIHEQNAVMGRANRALGSRVTAIAGGFLKPEGEFAEKITVTGNPVREAVRDAARTAFPELMADGQLNLLVFGGSQGARYFSETVPQAIALLESNLQKRLSIVQQARPEDEDRVRKRYGELGVQAEIASFFKDLPQRMAQSHLVISRSGASSVLELAVIGRPAILVPLPHALDDDQGHNAQLLVDAGGAIMRRQPDLDSTALAGELSTLLDDPERLQSMARNAASVALPDAARLLGDLTEAIASGKMTQK